MLKRDSAARRYRRVAIIVAVAGALTPSASLASRRASAGLRVTAAAPVVDASDRPVTASASPLLTFSPDGDHRNDTIRVRVTASRRTLVQLIVEQVYQRGVRIVARTAPVIDDARGVTLAWNGLTVTGQPFPDGSYIVLACRPVPAPRSGDCAAHPAIVHLRLLSAGITEAASFAPGALVPLDIRADQPVVTIQLYDAVAGSPVTSTPAVELAPGLGVYQIPSDAPPGLARLRVATATATRWLPIVIRDGTFAVTDPPAQTILVVWPYLTWRAYDAVDSRRVGILDTWYAHFARGGSVPLTGPYEDPQQTTAQGAEQDEPFAAPFMPWYRAAARQAQFVTDVEAFSLPAAVLDRYQAIVFAGHEEYTTSDGYNAMLAYRDRGGRLALLSANSFFGLVRIAGSRVVLVDRPPHQGTRDQLLVGNGFRSCCWPRSRDPVAQVAAGATAALPWLFTGTNLADQSIVGAVGGEADGPNLATPTGVTTVFQAQINGAALAATDYQPAGGGEVFDAGNMLFLDDTQTPPYAATATRLLTNLWTHMASP